MKPLLTIPIVLFTALFVRADDLTGDAATIEYLQSRQTNVGAFTNLAPAPNIRIAPTLQATSAGIRALHLLGAKAKNPDAAKKYVASCFNAEAGGFSAMPGNQPEVATTAIGLMAVKALDMPMDTYAPAAEKFLSANAKSFEDIRIAVAGLEASGLKSSKAKDWAADIIKLRNPDGVFGKDFGQARDTAGAIVALLRLGEPVEHRNLILKTLRDGQRPNGGFGKGDDENGADLETSYRVMRAFHMLKEKPARVEALRTYVAKCRNEDGGYSLVPGETSTVGATYYATIIKKWLE
jgi:prenyltransferase beta subunit